jgi:hypothetical protein
MLQLLVNRGGAARAPFLVGASWHMTVSEMNGFDLKKTSAVLGLLIAASGAGACAGPQARGEALSPLSARVDALVQANRTYPRWTDFPGRPTDVPPVTEIAAEVTTLNVTGNTLQREVAAPQWEVTDPAALGRSIQSRIDAAAAAPVSPETAAEIEAFVRRQRERSTPPPPIR